MVNLGVKIVRAGPFLYNPFTRHTRHNIGCHLRLPVDDGLEDETSTKDSEELFLQERGFLVPGARVRGAGVGECNVGLWEYENEKMRKGGKEKVRDCKCWPESEQLREELLDFLRVAGRICRDPASESDATGLTFRVNLSRLQTP